MAQRVDRLFTPPADLPPVRWAHWVASSVLTGAALVAVAVLGLVRPSWLVRSPLDPDGLATGGVAARGAVVLVLVVVLATTFTYSFWRFRLEVLAWRPGPLTVLPFGDDRESRDGPALAARLTASFEEQLARTKIYGATAVPAAGRPSDFLRVVEEAGDRVQGVWGAVSRFVRILAPVSAFRVACSLQTGGPDAPCVLVVELTRLTRTSVPPFVIEEHTWQAAVERAARAVAATVLPRTEQCRNAPWAPWQGLRLPVALFDAYQRFLALRASRHFDEAMTALRHAIRLDPGNPALRLERGKLQERMQMYLDALLTYDDLITNAARRDDRLGSWWLPAAGSGEPGAWRVAPTRGRPSRDPVVLVARYRHALLLGLSGRLAAQWWARPEGCRRAVHRTSREERRAHLRAALRTRLAARYPGHLSHPAGEPSEYLGDLLPGVDEADRRRRTAGARVFFTTVAQLEFERLVRDHVELRLGERVRARRMRRSPAHAESFVRWSVVAGSGRRPARPAPVRGAERLRLARILPREAVLLGLPWVCMRRAMALSWADRTLDGVGIDVGAAWTSVTEARSLALPVTKALVAGGWPVAVADLEPVVHAVTGAPARGLRSWRAHFNGACVLALPLVADDAFDRPTSAPSEQDRVARAAVSELERAVACTDSGFLAQQRDWLLIEDPDLSRLRGRAEFQDFEARTYGSISAVVDRGPDIHTWEQCAYVARFVSSAATEMAAVWARRRGTRRPDAATTRRWAEEEMAGWYLAERLALDSRSPGTREDVARRIAEAGALPRPPSVPHPPFSDAVLDQQLAVMSGAGPTATLPLRRTRDRDPVAVRVRTAIAWGDERLASLAVGLRGDEEACCPLGRTSRLHDEERELARLVGAGTMTPQTVLAWCTVSEERWSALASWFDDESHTGRSLDARGDVFHRAIGRRWWTER